MLKAIRGGGAVGEIRYTEDERKGQMLASDVLKQNVWMGVSQPGMADARTLGFVGRDRFMWGSDYPHDEGTMPYTREHLRQIFSSAPETEMRKILAGNAAEVYGFDLDKLAPLASKVGPTVGEIATPLDVLPDPPNEALLKGVDV
jgi:hypothetical protein